MKPARVRIIGGQWKRTPLAVPEVQGLRPTPDRVRETLFNWLGQDLSGWHCLDAFAGSGALGFEAASRGAARVVMIESDRRVFDGLCSLRARLGADQIDVRLGDALAQMDRLSAAGTSTRERFDLIFLDPPFGQGWLTRALPRALALLNPGGRLYVESEAPLRPGGPQGSAQAGPHSGFYPSLTLLRSDKAGRVHYHLFGL